MNVKFLKKIICYIIIVISFNCSSIKNHNYEKTLIDIGDSLTAGAGGEGTTMSNVASRKLPTTYTIKNMGIGGENTLTIGARQGGIPMYIKESIIIPSNTTKVEIPSGVYSSYNNKNILPLSQGFGGFSPNHIKGSGGINPCYIDGIECLLSKTSGKYFINRTEISPTDHVTKPNSVIVTSLSKQTEGILTIFIGQNGGYSSPDDLLKQINLIVKHKGDKNVIVITSHGNGTAETVQTIQKEYGNKLIDFKKYMSETAIYDAIRYRLLPDNGTLPSENDLNAMKLKKAPPSLLFDRIHLNKIGYELLGRLRFKKGQELGYW